MKTLIKSAAALALVFGASAAMADCDSGILGMQERPGTLGEDCCVYDGTMNRDMEYILVLGVIKDAYNAPIYGEDEVTVVGNEAVIKCALPKKEKGKGPRKNPMEETATNVIVEGGQCAAPKTIVEEVEAVEDNPDTEEDETVVGSEAELTDVDYTGIWQNIVSASGEVSLVCKHLSRVPN